MEAIEFESLSLGTNRWMDKEKKQMQCKFIVDEPNVEVGNIKYALGIVNRPTWLMWGVCGENVWHADWGS